MGKGIKILQKVISVTLMSLIILPVALSLLLEVPAIQQLVVHKATELISRKLETTFAIGRVSLSWLGKVRIEKLYVEDYQRDTLLYANHVEAYITGLGIFGGGGVELSYAEISDADFALREAPDGEMNITQVVNKLANPNPNPNSNQQSNFRLTLRKASIENLDFSLVRIERNEGKPGMNFRDLHVDSITTYIDDFTIDGSDIFTSIQSLSAQERGGFRLNELSGRFYLSQGSIGFEELLILTPQSRLHAPYVALDGGEWSAYGRDFGSVNIRAALRGSELSTEDLAQFIPALASWHTTLTDINLEASGTIGDATARIRSLRLGQHSILAAEASIKGLPDIKNTHFDATLSRLSTSAPDVERLAHDITGRSLPKGVAKMLSRAGHVELTAHFRGMLTAFDTQLALTTGVGKLTCDVRMQPYRGDRHLIRGDIAMRSLRLGELLNKDDLLGDATLAARVDGVVGKEYANAKVVGSITKFGFKGYIYDSLRFDGRLRNKEFDGRITARDPNLDFDFLGLVNFNDSVPDYDFTLALRHADLARLNINRRDSISQLSANLVAKASGNSLDNMNGRIRITDANYRFNDKEIKATQFILSGTNSATSKLVELRSDFADVTFRSKTGYSEVFRYLQASAWRYLPLLHQGTTEIQTESQAEPLANDFSLLSIDIRKINAVADAISPGLQIADGSSLNLLFNPVSNQLSFRAKSEYIERRNLLATHLNINASNRGDSLTFYASAEDLYAGGIHLPSLSVTGGAKEGRVQVSTGFSDTVRHTSGLLGLRASVVKEQGDHGRVVELSILPSHITTGGKTWQIYTHSILLDSTQVVIDKFYMMNREQEMFINGVASRSLQDSVTLSLHNFDLAPFSQLADAMGYGIQGRTNGSATMKSVLRGGEITADITVDSLAVNGIEGPPLRLTSRWDLARSRARLAVINREKRDTLIRGFFAPNQMRYYAHMTVDSLNLGLLDPILSGIISSTKGFMTADMTLQGEGRKVDLSGQILVQGLSTRVDYTQVTYSMPKVVLKVEQNRFRATQVPMTDEQGNPGYFNFDMNLQHLSNITYDVRVAPQHMLVLNTDAKDNEVFYGKVYATGQVRISGDKGGVNMDIAATTNDNSSFHLPFSSKSNISNADFVTFIEPTQVDTTDGLASRKKLFERQRKEKNSSGGGGMNISLALNVQPNVDVQISISGNVVRARGDGTLNMQINPREGIFEMYGDYTINEGSYLFSLQNILNKKFTIQQGSTIQWTGSPVNAILDIEAIYKLKTSLQPLVQSYADEDQTNDRSVPVECVIRLTDRLSNPGIGFDVRVTASDPEMQTVINNSLNTPETTDMQFLYLLLLGNFMSDNASNANSSTSIAAASGLGFLASQLSSWLSTDDYNVVLRYRPKSELTSDEVDFGLSKSLINNRLFVEVEGNYLMNDKRTTGKSLSNFMGEAYVTYLIDKAGSLRLKAFTQTIDRFDENQGLQETGIGIYYKEDFKNFRDLRQRVKDRFSNKKRKERRAEREYQRLAADTISAADSVVVIPTTKNTNK